MLHLTACFRRGPVDGGVGTLGQAAPQGEAYLARRLLHLLRPGMRLLRARCGLRSRVSQWREGHEDLSHELQIRRLGPRIPSGSAFSGSAPPRPPGPMTTITSTPRTALVPAFPMRCAISAPKK